MQLSNTTSSEDKAYNVCLSFGGSAAECADALERLDQRLTEALERISELEEELKHPNKN